MSFSRDLPNPGNEPESLKSPAWVGRFFYHCAAQRSPNPRACEYVTLHAKGILQL